MPLVSVILTSFNHEKFIHEAIESILNQSFQDFELIIWDDASVDASWELIKSYSDQRIRAFRNPQNQGPTFGVNKAIFEIALGKYIAIHHSDDVWELDKLKKQVDFLEGNADIGAVFSNAQPINERGEPLTDTAHFYYNIFNQPNRSRHEWLRFFFLNGNALCHPSILIRKKCYEDCGPYLDMLAQLPDFDMWIRLCKKYDIHIMDDRLIKFRILDGELNASGSRPTTRVRSLNEYYKLLQRYRYFVGKDEIFKIFPDYISHDRGENTDPEYVLARVCLESPPFFLRHLLAIEILFDIFNNPLRRQVIENAYGFFPKDLIKITGAYDAFSREELLGFQAVVSERDEQIASLNQVISERDGQIVSLNQAMAERDEQIANLSQAMAERDGQITKLIHERDSAIANSAALRRSMSWRLTTPFRFVGHIIKGDFKTAANVIRAIFSISEQQRTLKGQTLPIWKRLALVVKGSRLASGIRFIHYGFIRGRDWYARNSRLPRMEELITLVKRAAAEHHNRLQGINEALLLTGFVLPKQLDPYQSWIIANQNSERAYEQQRTRLRHALGILPKISVVMPVHNPPQEFFELAVASLRNQIYENWELCIADDASSAPWLRQRLHELADDDKRIRICFRERNGNISLASNSAAELATGDFLLFFDQDDLLTIDALAEVALYLAEHTITDVLYSDDDKIDSDGKRFAPQFKPDWSPELLLSYMYISHLFVVRRTLFEAVNGFRQGFEGSQDYDLALRVTERARSIAHLPYVLYHWRVLPGSTATSGDAKPASFEAGRRAVAEAFSRRGVEVTVFRPDWAVKGGMGIFWHDFPDDGLSVSILIPTKNQKEILRRCIDSLKKTTYRNFEIVIIDNGSDDQDTLDYLDSLRCRVLKIRNPMEMFNYAYINNRAVEQVSSKYVLFLNNDTEVRDPKWLSRMIGYAGLVGVGAVGARLLYPDGRIQHAGIVHGYYDGMAGPAFKLQPNWHYGYLSYGMVTRNYSAVTAACLLTPRQIFLEHGGFDEKQFSVAYNDVDYCYRLIDSGLRCVYSPGSELYHHEGFSRGFKDDPREVLAFRHKYSGRIDRYYNPNLSLLNEQFEIQPRRIVRDEEGQPIRALMCAFNLNLEGAPYSQYEMTIELMRKGVIAPVVYSPNDGPLRSLYESVGIEVVVQTHPLNGVFTIDAYDLGIDKFANWIRGSKFEMVYGNTLQTFYAIDAARRCGLPSLWNVRESEPWRTYFNYLPSPIRPKALSCFSFPYRIIFVAHATRNRYEPLNTVRNFCMIHNGLNMPRLEESRAKWGRTKARKNLHLDDGEIMVLLLGTVCPRKGQKDIVEAMSLLSDDAVKKVRLFIVGDRPSSYSSEMKAMVFALPKERSRRISIIPETEETALYYSAADIFVCTSRVESYPRVILEAMAYGLPIISTPAFGIVEQIRSGVNGEFYQEGNAVALVDKLSSLIFNKIKRETYQMNSKIVLESLTGFEEMINQYAELVRESVAV